MKLLVWSHQVKKEMGGSTVFTVTLGQYTSFNKAVAQLLHAPFFCVVSEKNIFC